MRGAGVVAHISLREGQAVSFILREDFETHNTQEITTPVVDKQQHDTQAFWFNWISKSKYKGRWREIVARSLLILKLLTFEPTGAIVAAPTFSIPEDIGGTRSVKLWKKRKHMLTIFLEIGTIVTVGFEILASPSTSSYEWGSSKKRTHT